MTCVRMVVTTKHLSRMMEELLKYFTYQEYCESFNSNFELMMTEDEYNKNPIPYPEEVHND